MAKPKLPTIPQAQVPQFGSICGGLLDGWSFGLDRIEVDGARVHLVVNATPPHWCFPTPVRLNPRKDFSELRAGPGATVHESARLIERAVEARKHGWSE